MNTAQQRLIEERLGLDAACRQPLYLKLLFEELRLWHSFDKDVSLQSPENSHDHIGGLLNQFFERLGLPANHGRLRVERSIGYLAAGRHGLSETEMLEVLFADREFRRSIVSESLARNHRMSRRPNAFPSPSGHESALTWRLTWRSGPRPGEMCSR